MDRRDSHRTPRILGITGPIGCGKTTVGDILLGLGALARIDADAVVHELMQPGTPTTARVACTFGTESLREDGAVDRPRLARIVFDDPVQLARLEAIVHPAVRALIRQRVQSFSGQTGTVAIDAVKLLQSDLLPMVEAVWVVQCPRQEQIRRLVDLRAMSPEAARARVRSQPSFDHPRVTRVIENDGSLSNLRTAVAAAWEDFSRLA